MPPVVQITEVRDMLTKQDEYLLILKDVSHGDAQYRGARHGGGLIRTEFDPSVFPRGPAVIRNSAAKPGSLPARQPAPSAGAGRWAESREVREEARRFDYRVPRGHRPARSGRPGAHSGSTRSASLMARSGRWMGKGWARRPTSFALTAELPEQAPAQIMGCWPWSRSRWRWTRSWWSRPCPWSSRCRCRWRHCRR